MQYILQMLVNLISAPLILLTLEIIAFPAHVTLITNNVLTFKSQHDASFKV